MKIKVGEYVRISYMYHLTEIAKVIKILDRDPGYKNMQMYKIDINSKHNGTSYWTNEVYKEDIIKHSHRIIDLIEER